jgi:LysR family glycine cleavage system transcriptional activator
LLPLNALRAFEAAARHRNFVDAAAELGVTPSAVSHQVKRLEEEIGTRLFDRGTRAVSLTKAGEAMAERLHRLFDDLELVVGDVSKASTSSLTVSTMASFATKWLAPRIVEFTALHPDLQVRVVAEDKLADFNSGGNDLAIRYGRGEYPGLEAEFIESGFAFPVIGRDLLRKLGADTFTPDILSAATLLHDETAQYAPGLPTWKAWFDSYDGPDIGRGRELVFGSMHMAIDAACAGQGVALALSLLVEKELNSGQLVGLMSHGLSSAFSFWLVYPKSTAALYKIRAFRGWLLDEIGKPLPAR